ncbi:MAG: ChaN family lipoprotein [Bacteroidota bacterium]
MKTHFLFLGILLLPLLGMAQMNKPAYQIFNQEGNITSYSDLLDAAAQAEVILFGELHNNPIAHWLQLELSQDLFIKVGKKLVLGAEMFEADNQVILNEYLNAQISDRHLTQEAKVWDNFQTDYQPLLDFAKAHSLPFVATNVPRRYASLVSRAGLEALEQLSAEAKNWMPPLPIEVDLEMPAYANMISMMGGAHGDRSSENFVKAQAIKDATMAHFILKNHQKGQVFLHFNGSYHSDHFESIHWYLEQQSPKLKILTISTIEQPQVEKMDEKNQNLAHFIICTPQTMTKTY